MKEPEEVANLVDDGVCLVEFRHGEVRPGKCAVQPEDRLSGRVFPDWAETKGEVITTDAQHISERRLSADIWVAREDVDVVFGLGGLCVCGDHACGYLERVRVRAAVEVARGHGIVRAVAAQAIT